MKYMNKFYDTGSIEKDFSWKGKVFSERVAKYPKILYKGLIPSGQKSGAILYPGGKKNLFSLRIDVDEVDELELGKYWDLFERFSKWITVFCCADAFAGKKHLLERAGEIGLDVQSHGFYHYTYNNYEDNYNNIARAKDFFESIGIHTTGFAAPMGKYNKSVMLALEALGYKYSSDFSFDYLNFPHYPRLDKGFSRILQVPIFPVCPEILFENGFSANEVNKYYDEKIEELKESSIPIIIYAHTNKFCGKVLAFLKRLLERIETEDSLHKCNMTDFAKICFSAEDAAFSRKYGVLSPGVVSGLSGVPGAGLIGSPRKKKIFKTVKDLVKNSIDYEDVTPIEELKNNMYRNALKIAVRTLKRTH